MAESAISTVLSTLANLAITETNLLMGVPDQVESIKSELRSMQDFLRYADFKQSNGDNSVAILVQEIRDVAYQAENVIAKINWMQRWNSQKEGLLGFISRYANVFHGELKMLHEVGNEIKKIKEKILEIFTRKERYDKVNLGESSQYTYETNSTEEDDLNMQRLVLPYFSYECDVVGFHNEITTIIEELIDPSNKDLRFVSLVGMGGIGKSTIANKVFTHATVRNCFDTFAWISVSRNYKPIELLKDIMKKTMNIEKEKSRNEGSNENKGRNESGITEQQLYNMPEQEARENLKMFLKKKKYLIVIDDVWSEKALDRITCRNMVFPNLNNGSRIILTTRNIQVANHTEYINHVHKLECLDGEKSWEFLRKKAFRFTNHVRENTLKDLENLGKQLANKCNGLPLALSVLGGFLSKNTDLNVWKNMVNNLDWRDTKSEKDIIEILALSFHDLPYDLKSCFLYMSCFPEDHLISTSKLTKMWIAENFIPFHHKCSQEDTARKYLNELAHRSMIQVVEMSKTYGWIKRIRMHDILRDFCIAESAKIGFLNICNNQEDFEASTSSGMVNYRIAFSKSSGNAIDLPMPNLRTLIGFDLNKASFCGLKYLRVLELVGIREIQKLSQQIGLMIFLRYISLRKCGRITIPFSIRKLINLQTFDARDTKIESFSASLWKIATLRHVYLQSCHGLVSPQPGELQNIQTLCISYGPVTLIMEVLLVALKEMSKLFSLYLLTMSAPLEILTVLSNHQNLQVLGISGIFSESRLGLPDSTFFPPNLRKLMLSKINLSEDLMPTLELLPCLVVLQLGNGAYIGERMSCSAGGFRQLQYMSIKGFYYLVKWEIEAGAMPRLSKLRLNYIPHLKMLPQELVHLPALEELQLIEMPDFPKETCDKIKEIGCKVIIEKYW